MEQRELFQEVHRTQWHTPLRKIVCLLFHRRGWRHILDFETATRRTGVVSCYKCGQWHILWFGKGKKMRDAEEGKQKMLSRLQTKNNREDSDHD